MPPERNRVLSGERISRARIDAAGEPGLDAIEEALVAFDHETAALLALARARTQPVPVELVSRILPGIELAAVANGLIAIASGDRKQLFDVLTERRFPLTKEAAELEAIVLYAAWKAGVTGAPLLPELRRLGARSMTAEGYALLATAGASVDDANTTSALKPIAAFAKEYAKAVAADDKAMNASVDAVIAALPAEVELSRGGFTVRAQKLPGRNDPCWCGSGQKFKKCCADKPVAAASPIEGLSWDEFLAGDKITLAQIDQLEIKDVLQIDFTRLQLKPLVAVIRGLADAHAWSHAERALAELARRPLEGSDADWVDDAREWLIQAALRCGPVQHELAKRHIALLSPAMREHYELESAIERGPAEAWDALRKRAVAVVASADKLDDVDLAYALLRVEPALGILFARACIGSLRVDDADALLDSVEDARDRLNLPPVDPAWDVLDALTAKVKRTPKAGRTEDAGALKEQLASSTARADQLERSLAQLRGELAAERTKPAAELVRSGAKSGELDGRIEELESLIREGQAERRDLRKQLEAAATATPVHEPRGRRLADDADEGVDDLPVAARGVTLPRFDRKFTDALADVPPQVASEAMRSIGVLSAGDGFMWKSVKQAKDMVRPLYMARVGIHHRLLFRCDDGVLDVMDLITRETLLTTLKRIRALR
ncbi:MAG TPA: SEC-C metal-binding domain-containing protein [Kofleriaceae bacterium]|nr:SEC-C metal-binding domain-containing protein [Kofleriaceae bacterium]